MPLSVSTPPLDDEPRGIKLRSRKIRIEVVRGPDAGATANLPGPEARLGSSEDCDFTLADPSVSRLHLRLRVEKDLIRVIDAGSRNGTRVDGVPVRDAYARPDSVIVLGGFTLRFCMLTDVVELPLSENDRFGRLLGRSVARRRLFALLERTAPAEVTLLFEGETGTGKELAAHGVHCASRRDRGPFVIFDCSAVPASLMESELFGQVRGAFTGAVSRQGRFEEADGDTLFLDEIGELPIELRPKLLRAIESRAVRRLGLDKPPRPIDVRILAATNRSLAREVDRGRFREDLYYRLAVVPIRLPPLRERLDDIPLLVRHFEEAWVGRATSPPRLPDAIVRSFAEQSWPGNIRELKNQVERALLLGTPELSSDLEAPESAPTVTGVSLSVPLLVGREQAGAAYEKAYLELALTETSGNVSRAAERAGVGRRFFQKAMKRHGLRDDDERKGVTGEEMKA